MHRLGLKDSFKECNEGEIGFTWNKVNKKGEMFSAKIDHYFLPMEDTAESCKIVREELGGFGSSSSDYDDKIESGV